MARANCLVMARCDKRRRRHLPMAVLCDTCACPRDKVPTLSADDMTELLSTVHKNNTSTYLQLGGEAGIHKLVDRFYELMEVLCEARRVRQMHPPSLAGSADSLFKFLSGWLGGPPLFQQERGHPRLRMRHAPFAVSIVERDEWMLCMRQAINEQVDDAVLNAKLQRMFSEMADHMINTDGSRAGVAAPL
jgi:hemoglobin